MKIIGTCTGSHRRLLHSFTFLRVECRLPEYDTRLQPADRLRAAQTDPRQRYADLQTGKDVSQLLRKVSCMDRRRFKQAIPKTFISELNRAEPLARKNLEQTAKLLSLQTKIPVPAWQRALKRQPWGAHYPVTPAVIASQQKVADFFFKGGYVQNQIAVGDAVIAMG